MNRKQLDEYISGITCQTIQDRCGPYKNGCEICGCKSVLEPHKVRSANTTIRPHEDNRDLRYLCSQCHEITHELLQNKRLTADHASYFDAFNSTKMKVRNLLVVRTKHYHRRKTKNQRAVIRLYKEIQAKSPSKKHRKRGYEVSYADRNKLLLSLGYADYDEYKRSSLWRAIRQEVLRRDANECVLCGKPADVVHHRGYGKKALLGKDLSVLVSLCHKCHHEVEVDADDQKRTLLESQQAYEIAFKNRPDVLVAKTVKRV